MNQQTTQVIRVETGKTPVAILLAFFFGPLGMLYVTVPGAIIMFFVSLIVAVLTFGLGLLITWPICIVWAAIAAKNSTTSSQIVMQTQTTTAPKPAVEAQAETPAAAPQVEAQAATTQEEARD